MISPNAVLRTGHHIVDFTWFFIYTDLPRGPPNTQTFPTHTVLGL